jgi:hypothetical protein
MHDIIYENDRDGPGAFAAHDLRGVLVDRLRRFIWSESPRLPAPRRIRAPVLRDSLASAAPYSVTV